MLSNLPSLSFFPVHRSCVLEENQYLQVWVQLGQSTHCSFRGAWHLCDLCSVSQHLPAPHHSSTQWRRDPHEAGSHFVSLLNLSGLGQWRELLSLGFLVYTARIMLNKTMCQGPSRVPGIQSVLKRSSFFPYIFQVLG